MKKRPTLDFYKEIMRLNKKLAERVGNRKHNQINTGAIYI